MKTRQTVVVLLLVATPILAWGRPILADDGKLKCQALEGLNFSAIIDAPTQVVQAQWLLGPIGGMAGVCQVTGYVAPSVHFVMQLPGNNWAGKFIEQGCGGFCGNTDWITECRDPLRRGYACIVSDMGHQSRDTEAMWAYNNLQAQIDFAYRSAHVVALAGKAIVERYYGRQPSVSYFTGCSTGGREALMEAQRFPWDFNGIIAGSPSLYITRHHMSLLWDNRALTDASGKPVLGQADLELVHRAAVSKCDLDDGVKDGVIGNPLACNFDPRDLLCNAGVQTQCLTAAQVEAVKKVYSGPLTSTGEEIFPSGGALKGSELTWLNSLVHWLWSSDPEGARHFVAEQFRYIAFDPAPGPSWTPDSFDFDRDYKRLGEAQGIFDADNPDLRQFKAVGGKLITYTGLNDAVGLALPPVDYYEMVERTMGGRKATQKFFRLFSLPGVEHCGGGDGAGLVDWLSYLEAWVEEDRPPDKILGFHPKGSFLPEHFAAPLPKEELVFSRPIYPYPTRAVYSGHGDPQDAASFKPVPPNDP